MAREVLVVQEEEILTGPMIQEDLEVQEALAVQVVQEEEILTGPVIQEVLVVLEVLAVLVVQAETVLTVQRVPLVLEDQVDQEVQVDQ